MKDILLETKVNNALKKMQENVVYRGKTYDNLYVLGTVISEDEYGRYIDEIKVNHEIPIESSIPNLRPYWTDNYPPFDGDEVAMLINNNNNVKTIKGKLHLQEDIPIIVTDDETIINIYEEINNNHKVTLRKIKMSN